jgi:hypothetical protein
MSLDIILTGLFTTLLGIVGWLLRSLFTRVSVLEEKITMKISEERTRLLIQDQMAPVRVEYRDVSRRLDELKEDNQNLNNKIDKLIEIVTLKK